MAALERLSAIDYLRQLHACAFRFNFVKPCFLGRSSVLPVDLADKSG